MRVSPAQKTAKSALRILCDTLGAWAPNIHMDPMWRALEAQLEQYARRTEDYIDPDRRFLLIDEAQILELDILKEVVDFPERFGLPVVLCGNADVLKRTRATPGAMAQITSRCAWKVNLSLPIDDDFVNLAIEFDVYGADARSAVVAFGINTSMRDTAMMLVSARAIAGTGPLNIEVIRHATLTMKGSLSVLGIRKSA